MRFRVAGGFTGKVLGVRLVVVSQGAVVRLVVVSRGAIGGFTGKGFTGTCWWCDLGFLADFGGAAGRGSCFRLGWLEKVVF